MVREWPTSIDVNMFTVAKLDPAILPTEIKVVTWSNVFGQGGSVSIDATMPKGTSPARVELARINKETSGSVVAERKHLQAILDGWRTDNLATDWAALVTTAKADVRDYYTKELARYGLRLAHDISAEREGVPS